MPKLTSAAIDMIVNQRTDNIYEQLQLSGVPFDYLSAVSLIDLGIETMIFLKDKEHVVKALREWADNIEKGKLR